MNTLNTDKKYTVILSAYLDTNTGLTNLLLTARLKDRLLNAYHVHPIAAVGVYQGVGEQSFVIHTNSSHTMGDLKRLGLEVYGQDSVLVSNNRRHDIQLHMQDCTTKHIGNVLKHYQSMPKGCHNYTVLNGCDYWVVS